MLLINKPNGNYTARQLKLPLETEKLIDISAPVYTFCEVMDHIDLSGYFVEEKGYKTGRPRCDAEKLLKVILFAFMDHGFCSLREIEKLCRTDIRYMYLLDEMKAPSFAMFGNFIRNELTDTIEQIFADVNAYIFEKDYVDLDHTYIDGTKIEANANKYTWVWKKSCIKNRDKMFVKISELIDSMNVEVLNLFGLKFDTREEYAIEYLETMLDKYESITGVVSLKRLLNQSFLKSWSSKMIKKSLEAYFFTLKTKIVFCKKQFQNMSAFCFVSTEIV